MGSRMSKQVKDRHSVNCFICHKLVDERECALLWPEGEICPKCMKLPQIHECEDCGGLYDSTKGGNAMFCGHCAEDEVA